MHLQQQVSASSLSSQLSKSTVGHFWDLVFGEDACVSWLSEYLYTIPGVSGNYFPAHLAYLLLSGPRMWWHAILATSETLIFAVLESSGRASSGATSWLVYVYGSRSVVCSGVSSGHTGTQCKCTLWVCLGLVSLMERKLSKEGGGEVPLVLRFLKPLGSGGGVVVWFVFFFTSTLFFLPVKDSCGSAIA